jgi:hypothetical protein
VGRQPIAKLAGMVELHSDITVGEWVYRRGEAVPARFIYLFFLVHMLVFGASGGYVLVSLLVYSAFHLL